jgi:hypothetical protein
MLTWDTSGNLKIVDEEGFHNWLTAGRAKHFQKINAEEGFIRKLYELFPEINPISILAKIQIIFWTRFISIDELKSFVKGVREKKLSNRDLTFVDCL